MGHCLLKITALSLYTVHFPNFFRPAKWLWTKPRPCNKWVTPLHRHIINEVLEMTEAFSLETKPNYKPRDIFNPLTMKDESRNVRAALIVPWWRREYEWINFTVFGNDSREATSCDLEMICVISNKSSTLPQCSFCSNAAMVLQMN